MIVYVCCEKYASTLGTQLHHFPGELAKMVRLVPYELLYRLGVLPTATYIFSDFDQLGSEEFARVCRLWDWMDESGSDLRRLNDPRKVLQRFPLLRRLHALGINEFNVYRLDEWREVQRFPVFTRRERGHVGRESHLIADRRALEAHVRRYSDEPDVADMMIVEFGTAPFPDGRYRKFGAFRVGEALYLQHCFITSGWYAKSVPAGLSDADIAEADTYRATNPHAEEVLNAFEFGAIEYGRADYTVVDGRVQIFEINTNPTIIGVPGTQTSKVDSGKFARLHENAMITIDATRGAPLPLPEDIRDRSPGLSLEQAHQLAARQVVLQMDKGRRRARRRTAAQWLLRGLPLRRSGTR